MAKERKQRLTPRQKKLIMLMPEVESGGKTLVAAMIEAGYSEESARQQSNTFGALRNNSVMQEALRKIGFTEDLIAESLLEGVTKLGPGRPKLGYIQAGAGLLDVVPSQKHEILPPMTYDDFDGKGKQKAKTPQEAKDLAEAE